MRVNNLGKLGIGLFLLGFILFTGFVYNELLNPDPDIFSSVLGFSVDYAGKILIFSNMIMLILLGITFYFASKTRRNKIEQ